MTVPRLKRAHSSMSSFNDRSSKRHDSNHSEMDNESDTEIPDVHEPVVDLSLNPKWQNTIAEVVQAVVSIHFSQVASFDCDSALVSEATGFVVDSKMGLILTNRHVVGAGPFVGYAVFDNHEECDLTPIYRDPVHDFGFLKFDPSKIKYMNIKALELRPSLAIVGSEIRVIGNDAGEKLSILSGFISRVDRNAPDYGELSYNDFNTEYIQAAASASGGSSGSPVVNIDGYAVALQAGGSTEASTDFFLPLDRILRALRCIQSNTQITRGTIQTQWLLKPYDECRRMGLSAERERIARKHSPTKIGLLVAETILSEGPAEGKIKEGDILISINDQMITSFIQVDSILDENIGNTIKILVQRSGEDVSVECCVGDLHAITPSRYVEVCGATFNELSYQLARFFAIPVKGVFLSSATGSFNFDTNEKVGWIVDEVDNKPTPNLDSFIEVMKNIPDCSRVTVRYHHLIDQHSSHVATVFIDRHWFTEFRLYERNDETGIWDYTNLGNVIPSLPLKPQSAKFIDLPVSNPKLAKLSRSLVTVSSTGPIPIDSLEPEQRKGSGLIIDTQHGYVLVSRRIVPYDCLDVFVTFAESVIIPASVEFLHPTQNYAVVKYDPALIIAPLESARIADVRLKRGDKIQFIGCTNSFKTASCETTVTDISSLSIPCNMVPRYRATNLEAISIESSIGSRFQSGILADDDGTVRALWQAFLGEKQDEKDKIYLMGSDLVDMADVINIFRNGKKPRVSIVDAGFGSISVLQARFRGVPDEWITRMENESETRLQFIAVTRVSYTKEKEKLENGDVILSLNGNLVKHMRDLQGIVTATDDPLVEHILDFKVVRKGKIVDLKIKTVNIEETSKLAIFAGCILQAPHHAARQAMQKIPNGVYCTYRGESSPAMQYGIAETNFITHINEIETPNIDKFLEVAKTIPDNTYCKLRLASFDNVPFAISLKTSYHYFPTSELAKDPVTGKWIEHHYNQTPAAN
ncbi:HCL431Cp [Eremothecium sinecaudum]|uniref:Pro-apoptotic serine protease NMA111 n=1 Tax=Eremothecium sinecaudum TaxID=45286 RepID=A0A109UW88_9SACH|nr:HCL431Cp [Eremothecium sinecaudum]AMD19720.1 HCL431Cp [Eremothecium sinecaudum]